jgi:ribokinase
MITVIGSINMDLVVTAKRAPDMGETVMGTSWTQIPGGKGANQAVAAARSGGETWMVGRLGRDAFGNTLLESLKRDPLHVDHIEMHEDAPTGIAAIVVDASGRNRITVISGANFTIHADDIDRLRPLIARSSVLLMQLEIPLDAVERALVIAKEENTFSILNPAPATELPDHFYQLADLMTPNESELAILSGCPTQTESEWTAACRALLDRGLSSVLVTLGEKGAFYVDQKTKRIYPAYRVTAVDTTAAGDSFNGTLASEIARYLKENSAKWRSVNVGEEATVSEVSVSIDAYTSISNKVKADTHANKTTDLCAEEGTKIRAETEADINAEDRTETHAEAIADVNIKGGTETHAEAGVDINAGNGTTARTEKGVSFGENSDYSPPSQIPYDILDRAIDRATRAAAITVTREGAQPSLPTAREIDDFDIWYEIHSSKRT